MLRSQGPGARQRARRVARLNRGAGSPKLVPSRASVSESGPESSETRARPRGECTKLAAGCQNRAETTASNYQVLTKTKRAESADPARLCKSLCINIFVYRDGGIRTRDPLNPIYQRRTVPMR